MSCPHRRKYIQEFWKGTRGTLAHRHNPYNLYKIYQRVVAQHLAHICLALIDETMYRNYWKGTRGILAHRHIPYKLYKIYQRVVAQHLAHIYLALFVENIYRNFGKAHVARWHIGTTHIIYIKYTNV